MLWEGRTRHPAVQGLQWHCTLLYSKVVAKSVQRLSRGKPATTPVQLLAGHVYKGVSGGAPAWTLDTVVNQACRRWALLVPSMEVKKTKECIEQW